MRRAGWLFKQAIGAPTLDEGGATAALPLLDAAVIAYARPFSYSRNANGDLKMPSALTEKEEAVHKKLISHRNEVVAHTDPRGVAAEFTFRGSEWQIANAFDSDSPHVRHLLLSMRPDDLVEAANLANKMADRYRALAIADLESLVTSPHEGMTISVDTPMVMSRVLVDGEPTCE